MPASSIDPANDPHGVSVGALAAALAAFLQRWSQSRRLSARPSILQLVRIGVPQARQLGSPAAGASSTEG
jgi:hypothetical protein